MTKYHIWDEDFGNKPGNECCIECSLVFYLNVDEIPPREFAKKLFEHKLENGGIEIVFDRKWRKDDWGHYRILCIAVSPECPSEEIDGVLSHETVHAAFDEILIGSLSPWAIKKVHAGWDNIDESLQERAA